MVAILFEGKSDQKFLNEVCASFELSIEKIMYYNFQGKDNIFDLSHVNYDDLENDINNLQRVSKVIIIVDADNKEDPNPHRGFSASKTKLEAIIKALDFSIPIDYYIMCDMKKEGNLESFLLSVLDENQLNCINTFRECYEYRLNDKWVYNTFYKQKKHPFDFTHPNFNLLKEKLQWLFQ